MLCSETSSSTLLYFYLT